MLITPKFEPLAVRELVLGIVGNPGLGKTSLGLTADNPLLIDFDGGAYRAAFRGDTVVVRAWQDVVAITAADVAPYDTIVVDTIGRAVDYLKDAVVARDPKNARKDGQPSQQGWGAIKGEMAAWLKKLRMFGKDIVLISHALEEKEGDETMQRMDITGGTKTEVYKICDVIGHLDIINGRRILNMDPTDTAFGKNPGRLDPVHVADDKPGVLAEVLSATKAHLNRMSEDQVEVQELLDAWTEKVQAAKTIKAFNALLAEGPEVDERIRPKAKIALTDAARKAGLEYSAEKKGFVRIKEDKDETANVAE